jgi:Ca-activated chloride channel homolog
MEVVFDNPIYLLFLLSLPLLVVMHYFVLKRAKGRVLQFANFIAMSRVATPQMQPRNILQLTIRLATLSFIVLAVSGMSINYTGFGANSDYVLAIDVSSSMLATDMEPSRLEAAKNAAIDFVSSVPEKTEIGLVAFSGTAFVEQKLTEDKEEIVEKISRMDTAIIGGTDLGEAIITSSNLLLSGDRSKTIILLTDGRSNVGVGTARAVDYVNSNNIQVFTIGIGTLEGGSPQGINVSLKLDEELLQKIAELTEAEYIFAKSQEEISDAYKKIITLTKKKISINMTIALMFLALVASFIDWVFMNTKYKRIP